MRLKTRNDQAERPAAERAKSNDPGNLREGPKAPPTSQQSPFKDDKKMNSGRNNFLFLPPSHPEVQGAFRPAEQCKRLCQTCQKQF